MRFVPFLVALLVLASVLPAAGEAGVRERNRAWVVGHLGDAWVPGGAAVVHSHAGAVAMTSGEALERVLDRMGDVDVGRMARAAGPPGFPAAGDVWLLEFGPNPCPAPSVATPVFTGPIRPPDPQLWVYGGPFGAALSEVSVGGTGHAIEWTLKESFVYRDEAVLYGGSSDFFCVRWGGMTLHFPFLDGWAMDTT